MSHFLDVARDYRDPIALAAHALGTRADGVRHACPDHPIGAVPSACPTCHGQGSVTEAELDRWLSIRNQATLL